MVSTGIALNTISSIRMKLTKLNILKWFICFPLHKINDNKGPNNRSKRVGPDLECMGFPE